MGFEFASIATGCPKCAKRMVLGCAIPQYGGHAEIRSYKCLGCGEVITRMFEPGDAAPWADLDRLQPR
jgi:hypothetical protein